MRVLHLIDLRDRSDESRLACAAALEIADARHRVIALGTGRDVGAARVEAPLLRIDAAFPPLSPWPEASFRRLRTLIGDRDGRDATRPWADVVQCWGPGVAGLARLASGHRTPPRVVALFRPPTVAVESLARRRLEYALTQAHTFTFDRAVRASWAERVSARRGRRLLEHNTRLLTSPAWATARVTPDERAAARARFGLNSGDFVISLLADPPHVADLAAFAFLLGLLFTTGVRVVGLARSGAEQHGGMSHATARRAARFVRLHGRRWGLNVLPESSDAILAASDASVWLAADESIGRVDACGPLLIQRSIARGVPVAAARDAISVEAIEFSRTHEDASCVARDGSLAGIADRLLAIAGHSTARPPRLHAAPRPDSFPADLLALWREVTNTPVAVPGLPTPLAMLEGAA